MTGQITIDGPAASGKSTVATLVARRLRAWYVNTGEMYRAVTWVALARGLDVVADARRVVPHLAGLRLSHRPAPTGELTLCLDGEPVPAERIRSPEVAAAVSYVAAVPEVREWLVARQRDTAGLGLVVMEGRDIGTVVFPRARHKFYLTASPEVRARRRLAQAGETVPGSTVASVAAEIAARDRLDSQRPVAPLRPAADAVTIDTDGLTADQVADRIVARVHERGWPEHERP